MASNCEKDLYYCGVEGSLSCTRIVVIKKTEKGDTDEGARKWKVTQGTNLEFVDVNDNVTRIADGINKLMTEVTGTGMWKSKAVIERIVVVFAQNKDKKMKEFESYFKEMYIGAEGISKELEVLPEVDVVALTHFTKEDEGIALQCGIDAFCRFRRHDNKLRSVVNHPEGAGGAYWIARTALQMVIEEMEKCEAKNWQKTDFIRKIFQEQLYGNKEMTTFAMNDELFTLKMKHRLGQITEELAQIPFKEENEYMKKVREHSEEVYKAMKEMERDGYSLDQIDGEESAHFLPDFQEEMAKDMESEEGKQAHERKLAQYDVIVNLFSHAGKHLGNLVSRTLNAELVSRERQKAREANRSSVSPVPTDTTGIGSGTISPVSAREDDEEPKTPRAMELERAPESPGSGEPTPTASPRKTRNVQNELAKYSSSDEEPSRKSSKTTSDMSAAKELKDLSKTTKIVLFGHMFDSLPLMEAGFLSGLSVDEHHAQVELYRMCEEPAVIAAIHAAATDGYELEFDEPEPLTEFSLATKQDEIQIMYLTLAEKIKDAKAELEELEKQVQEVQLVA